VLATEFRKSNATEGCWIFVLPRQVADYRDDIVRPATFSYPKITTERYELDGSLTYGLAKTRLLTTRFNQLKQIDSADILHVIKGADNFLLPKL